MWSVAIYPVGFLHDVELWWLFRRHPDTDWTVGRLARQVRRSWRERSYWTGYLAEPSGNVPFTRAGHGWTRRRARRDLINHIASLVPASP